MVYKAHSNSLLIAPASFAGVSRDRGKRLVNSRMRQVVPHLAERTFANRAALEDGFYLISSLGMKETPGWAETWPWVKTMCPEWNPSKWKGRGKKACGPIPGFILTHTHTGTGFYLCILFGGCRKHGVVRKKNKGTLTTNMAPRGAPRSGT